MNNGELAQIRPSLTCQMCGPDHLVFTLCIYSYLSFFQNREKYSTFVWSQFYNIFLRTLVSTLAAADAFFVIDKNFLVNDRSCGSRTMLFTFFASGT